MPGDDACPCCGLQYDAFRTELTFGDVRAMLWTDDPDPSTWKYKRRNTVLGLWRMTKLQMWAQHLAECQWYFDQEAAAE